MTKCEANVCRSECHVPRVSSVRLRASANGLTHLVPAEFPAFQITEDKLTAWVLMCLQGLDCLGTERNLSSVARLRSVGNLPGRCFAHVQLSILQLYVRPTQGEQLADAQTRTQCDQNHPPPISWRHRKLIARKTRRKCSSCRNQPFRFCEVVEVEDSLLWSIQLVFGYSIDQLPFAGHVQYPTQDDQVIVDGFFERPDSLGFPFLTVFPLKTRPFLSFSSLCLPRNG